MFEKEAKKYSEAFESKGVVEASFIKGAEFGYNKANEWHDLRRDNKDLPKENMKQVMVITNSNECLMGWYSYPRNTWWDNECPDPQDRIEQDDIKVIKWKEIVLPKEIE